MPFKRYILLVLTNPPPFFFQTAPNLWWLRFNKMLGISLSFCSSMTWWHHTVEVCTVSSSLYCLHCCHVVAVVTCTADTELKHFQGLGHDTWLSVMLLHVSTSRLSSRALLRPLPATASCPTARLGRGSTTTASKQPTKHLSHCHSHSHHSWGFTTSCSIWDKPAGRGSTWLDLKRWKDATSLMFYFLYSFWFWVVFQLHMESGLC